MLRYKQKLVEESCCVPHSELFVFFYGFDTLVVIVVVLL